MDKIEDRIQRDNCATQQSVSVDRLNELMKNWQLYRVRISAGIDLETNIYAPNQHAAIELGRLELRPNGALTDFQVSATPIKE